MTGSHRTARIVLAVAALATASLILHRDDLARLLERGDPTEPAWVEDRSGLLTPAQRTSVSRYHAELLEGHDIDYRVLTLPDGGDINRRAHEHFETAGVGASSAGGRGLLLVIDTASDRVRLEVSTALEGIYTDAFVAYVQNRQMVPFFRTGRVADAIVATTELIVTRAQEAEAGQDFAPPMPAASMGGGATAPAGIGTGEVPAPAPRSPRSSLDVDVGALAPLQVVELYLAAMAARDARPDLPFYSADTVRMLAGWTVTPAQMDNVARTYRDCTAEAVRVHGALAVVRYPVEQRLCAPWFLRHENDAWKLDLTMMSSSIRFNHANHWRFEAPRSHEYVFAFDDWRFDRSGFPLPRD